ncbi:GNAT family N-acetyltransferase [Psychrobacillus sp. OK032]|uniref:GNAT family N-acetyltransferase n=1 Tax=Psychrobacillus sp. OK032 TaxID=1884358 RepID=UPI0008B0607C|nr:GNAT family N-acetyltransferase [Psychrobacillus sp. OK032]SES44694.1 Acetyltransferase (GNAT) family protein [Psychrobacillus sp. OK032]
MVIIRNLEKSEFEFLTDMLYESIYIPENKPNKEDLINSPYNKKYHVDWGRNGDTALIALNTNNQALGAVWYRLFDEFNKGYGFVDSKTPELGIAVTKEARGNGVGTLLMEKIIHQAMYEGYKSISLSVDPNNSNAVHIYKKMGFKDYEESGTSITMIYRVSE